MILGDEMIYEAMAHHGLLILPFRAEHVQPASYDLTLAGPFLYPGGYCGPVSMRSVPEYAVSDGSRIFIKPQEFVLASTEETVHLPNTIAAQVDGRSTMGRLGLAVHITAGWIDPGFQGRITLEICNHGPKTIELHEGDRIAQLILYQVFGCGSGYCGRYQGQEATTGARVQKEEA